MDPSHVCLLQLLLIAAAAYGNPTTSNPQDHAPHVPHEPKAQPPLHASVGDKPAQPFAPRDASDGSIPCIMDKNCTTSVMGEHSICHGSFCSCTTETTQSPISKRCLRESSMGSQCLEDWQCKRPLGPNVACVANRCTCISGSAPINGKCLKQKLLSESCTVNEECIKGVNSLCEDNKCKCKLGMAPRPTNDLCLLEAKGYQDPCEEDIQCTIPFGSLSACTNGKCVCLDGSHFRNHKCMKNLNVGDQCGVGVDGDCFLVHDMGINHVECVQNTCQCRGDRTPSSDNQRCLSPGQTDPGSGGAECVQPLLITFVTILLARLLSS